MTDSLQILFQPKQAQVADLMEFSAASWIGVGGGRGCAKSYLIDAEMLERRYAFPGTVGCVVMRNWDQVYKYHIEPLKRAWPQYEPYLKETPPASLRLPNGSQIDFTYGETLADIERRFRSANYFDIMVDQAEQFYASELREMRKANRSPGAASGKCKMLLSFNMGGAGIQDLKKWFHTREYNERESSADFEFVHVFPWDNVEWSRSALEDDGFTGEIEFEGMVLPRWFHHYYYELTNDERMQYCATRSDYGRALDSDDDAIRNRDWLGSWESLEGAFYGRVFDRKAVLIDHEQLTQLVRPWDTRWLSQDWGKSHYCATHWHAKTIITPDVAARVLGWAIPEPVNAVITYRELVINELSSPDVARRIVDETPLSERKQIQRFFLSPDAFGERDSDHTTAGNQGAVLKLAGLPDPEPADTDRAGGWRLMYDMLANTKRRGEIPGDVWLIGAECAELLNALPVLMRDPKNLDDVLKTDKGAARVEQDVSDSARYGLKSMLSPRSTRPKEVERAELHAAYAHDRTAQAMQMQAFESRAKRIVTRRPRWR